MARRWKAYVAPGTRVFTIAALEEVSGNPTEAQVEDGVPFGSRGEKTGSLAIAGATSGSGVLGEGVVS
jgi:hypothetical protein